MNLVDPYGLNQPGRGFVEGLKDGFHAELDGIAEALVKLSELDFSGIDTDSIIELIKGALTGMLSEIGPMLGGTVAQEVLKRLLPYAVLAQMAWIVGSAAYEAYWSCESSYTFGFELSKGLTGWIIGALGGTAAGIALRWLGEALDVGLRRLRGKGNGPKLPGTGETGGAPSVGQECFLAGTLVLTPQGTARIEDIQAGDLVLSRDERTGQQDYKKVVEAYQGTTDRVVCIRITRASLPVHDRRQGHAKDVCSDPAEVDDSSCDEAETLRCSPPHPFWVEGKGWVRAEALSVGDRLLGSAGEALVVVGHEIQAQHAQVFNIQIGSWHTYFVSERAKSFVWVHNKPRLDPRKIVLDDGTIVDRDSLKGRHQEWLDKQRAQGKKGGTRTGRDGSPVDADEQLEGLSNEGVREAKARRSAGNAEVDGEGSSTVDLDKTGKSEQNLKNDLRDGEGRR